jgi:hypothetical protein
MGLPLSLLGLLVMAAVIGFGVYFLLTRITIKEDNNEKTRKK